MMPGIFCFYVRKVGNVVREVGNVFAPFPVSVSIVQKFMNAFSNFFRAGDNIRL